MTIKEIDAEIDRLKAQRREIENAERESYKISAFEFVGRCFLENNKRYIKILGVPCERYTMTSVVFNRYEFPAITLIDDELVPFVEEEVNMAALFHKNPFSESIKEITHEEFLVAFEKQLLKFRKQMGV